jgi:outer membrane protein assembly factor BamB
MHRRPARAILASALALLAACSSASTGGGETPTPTLWTFEEFAWYRFINKVSMNSTVGPVIVDKTVLYGGSYGYTVTGQETRTSRLALLDAATGQARWRIERAGTWGPMALHGEVVAMALGDHVVGFDLASGVQRWDAPVRARSLTAVGDVVLVAERETIRALDIVSGAQRWQATSTTDPVAAGDTALFMDGEILRAVAAGDGIGRWSLELPAALAYPQSLLGDHLYLLGTSSLGSVNIKTRTLEWVAPLGSAPTAGITAADDTLYFTTQAPSGSYVFHAFEPATQKERWSRPLDSSSRVAPVVMGPLVATAANASADSLVALSRGTGMVAWSARAGSVSVQPVLKGKVLYVAGQGPNRVYAFDAATGAVLWSGRLWGWPMGMALTEDGTLLVSADNLTLYAYRTQ